MSRNASTASTSDDYVLLAALAVFHGILCAQRYFALARFIGLFEFVADDEPAGGKVRAGDYFHKLVQRYARTVYHGARAVYHLAEVVRGYVCGQTDGYAVCAVDQQIGIPAGQNVGLEQAVVEVERKGNGLLVDVAQKLERERLQPGFGISHRGGGVAVHRAEVAVPVDERHAHVEILRHAHHGVVDGAVAVGVILAHAVADDARGLFVRLVGGEPHLGHGVEYAPLNGLEPVLHAGQGAVKNYEFGIGQHGLRHHVLDGSDKHVAGGYGRLKIVVILSGHQSAASPSSRLKFTRSINPSTLLKLAFSARNCFLPSTLSPISMSITRVAADASSMVT